MNFNRGTLTHSLIFFFISKEHPPHRGPGVKLEDVLEPSLKDKPLPTYQALPGRSEHPQQFPLCSSSSPLSSLFFPVSSLAQLLSSTLPSPKLPLPTDCWDSPKLHLRPTNSSNLHPSSSLPCRGTASTTEKKKVVPQSTHLLSGNYKIRPCVLQTLPP